MSSKVSRRRFFHTLSAAGTTVAAGSLVVACADDLANLTEPSARRNGGGGGGGKGNTTRNPLRVPSTVSPQGRNLQAAPGNVTIVPGKTTSAWMYNGELPGPTIVADRGSLATMTFQNGLPQDSITHWHGMLVDHPNDGHPQEAVGSGSSYNYAFTVNQRAALNWYHPHPHGLTGEQVYRGLAGAFILRDSVDTGQAGNPLGLPSGAYEVPLVIRDASFDNRGNFRFSNKSSGFWGDTPLVNGTYAPYLGVNRGVYRFRVLNGCNARVLRLALSNGGAFTLVGNDGGLLDTVQTVTEIMAAPGERFDILLDFAQLANGETLMLREMDTLWDILEFRGTGQAGTGSLPSGALSTITPLSGPVASRTFSFDGMTRINGKVYDMAAVEFTVPFDRTERWTFVTNGNGPHPVHVHGVMFQVVSRTGGRGQVYPWERGWKDTVLLHDGETVEVLIRFTAYRGLYVMHCHQLAHEDAGMMANFEVV